MIINKSTLILRQGYQLTWAVKISQLTWAIKSLNMYKKLLFTREYNSSYRIERMEEVNNDNIAENSDHDEILDAAITYKTTEHILATRSYIAIMLLLYL